MSNPLPSLLSTSFNRFQVSILFRPDAKLRSRHTGVLVLSLNDRIIDGPIFVRRPNWFDPGRSRIQLLSSVTSPGYLRLNQGRKENYYYVSRNTESSSFDLGVM